MQSTETTWRPYRGALLFLCGAAVFAAAYGQAPLYYSNQNQYFLHGLAAAGAGELRHDWLANTRDPTPLFSGLVAFTARFLHPWLFHVYYGLLLGVYAATLLGLFVFVVGREAARPRWPLFVLFFVLLHSALVRWASYRWLGLDYPWYFQSGVAGQYILGPMFQPSTFGVLLVVAVWLFVTQRPYLAAVCLALGATLHTTYLLHAGMLTVGFLVSLWSEGKRRQAFGVGALAFVLVLPVIAYVLLTFRPTSPEQFAQAQHILVHYRLPHHSRPDLWIDLIAALQIAWIALGIVLAGSQRLRLVLGVTFLLAVLLTLVQVVTGNDTLAALFPWRVSAVLMPVATTILLSRAVQRLRFARRALPVAAVLLLAAAGLALCLGRWAFFTGAEEAPLLHYVRQQRRPGDLYLIPVREPDLARKTRGSKSSDFQPLPDKRRDPKNIPVDLQGFRLETGAPIFVDFKSIPYQDVDLIEWHERIQATLHLYQLIEKGSWAEAVPLLRARGVTHVVVKRPKPTPNVPDLERLDFEDAAYEIYRLR